MTLDEAIEIVREEYQKALELHWVWSPISYAMYKAKKRIWEAEKAEERRREGRG